MIICILQMSILLISYLLNQITSFSWYAYATSCRVSIHVNRFVYILWNKICLDYTDMRLQRLLMVGH